MTLNTALWALMVLTHQPQTSGSPTSPSVLQEQKGTTDDAVFPGKLQSAVMPAEFLGWRGWTYLQGAPSVEPTPFDSIGDWTDVRAKISGIKAEKPPSWRMKIVIFTRLQADERDSAGVLREQRQTIESVQLAQIQTAIQRFSGWVTAKTNGHLSVVPDVQVESDWMRDKTTESSPPFGPPFITRYLEARINGGSYEAEDKVFRGPFNSVIYILPGSRPSEVAQTVVNDTPVSGLSARPLTASGTDGNLDVELQSAWLKQLDARAKDQGYKGIATAPTGSTEDVWSTVTSLDEPAPQVFLARQSSLLSLNFGSAEPVPIKVAKAPATEATIVTDPDRGQVLKVVEAAGFRTGGIALPSRADKAPLAKLDTAPTLSFMARSSSRDPLSIRLESSDGKVAWVSIGQDAKLVTSMPGASIFSAQFIPDGKWQKVSIDLKSALSKLGLADINTLVIEPSPNTKIGGKIRADIIEYEFDEFKFGNEAANPLVPDTAPDPASDDAEARALYAAQAKASSPELAALLKDKNELVRLNATAAYNTIKDPTVESALVSNSLDLDPSVAGAALKALMNSGTESALSVIRQSVRVAFSDYAKQTAGALLAESKDPKLAGDVSLLWSNRSWNARLSAVDSMAKFGTPESHKMMMTFLVSDDPEIKLAVTRHTDPNIDDDARKLLWSAVNEPSDRVRADSDIKLIQSSTSANRIEGFKGVHDDSKYVRLVVLDYLANHPSEENRNALRMAVADKSARVRAAALRGFGSLASPPSLEEIANILDDSDPKVLLSLIDVAKKHSLKLPQKTLDIMMSSLDPRVPAAAKTLGTGTSTSRF